MLRGFVSAQVTGTGLAARPAFDTLLMWGSNPDVGGATMLGCPWAAWLLGLAS
jgi:hypothetical protein